MFFEVVKSEGIAHLSYLFGDENVAAVVDPRRDCEIYLDIASRKGARITHIFETHRNEDYVIGSRDLARRTGADIYHGNAIDFHYGRPVADGDTFELESLKLKIIETPGHTFESISVALIDTEFSEEPVAVFTGDALFIGDVGRTDFFPDRAEEVAGLLYDSIFQKLLPLGDNVLLYPAHGAGSVCGSGMASREISSLGYERKNNPVLQYTNRDKFIQYKVNEHHYLPPYFRKMEEYNQNGNAPLLDRLPTPLPYSPGMFEKAMLSGMVVVDIRSPEAFGGAFIPGSYCMPESMVPVYAGWFLDYESDIGFVAEDFDQVTNAVRHLARIGYDNVKCYLQGGMNEWESSGRGFDHIPPVHCLTVEKRMESGDDFVLLDVRKKDELEKKRIKMAKEIYLGFLPDQLSELPKDKTITTFCGSGQRAMIAASILKMNGFHHVENNLGSMSACVKLDCSCLERP